MLPAIQSLPTAATSSPIRTGSNVEHDQDITDKSNYTVQIPVAALMAEPRSTAECVSEALYGEQLELLEHQDDWVFVRLRRDGYKGFIQAEQISPSHKVTIQTRYWVIQRSTLLFGDPDMKSVVLHRIPFGSELQLTASGVDSFSQTACGYYVWTDHCVPIDQHYPGNVLTLASRHFLGTPYRWGGRSPEGVDCSGLIQALARSQGIVIPRDSDDQETYIESRAPLNALATLDLVYWPGHTGILISPTQLLHATAFTLDCRIEPLDEVVKRAGAISSVRRLFDTSQVD